MRCAASRFDPRAGVRASASSVLCPTCARALALRVRAGAASGRAWAASVASTFGARTAAGMASAVVVLAEGSPFGAEARASACAPVVSSSVGSFVLATWGFVDNWLRPRRPASL